MKREPPVSSSTPFAPLAYVGVVFLVISFVVAFSWVTRAAGTTGGLFDTMDFNGGAYALATAALANIGFWSLVVWYLGSQHVIRTRRHQELVGHLLRLEEPRYRGSGPSSLNASVLGSGPELGVLREGDPASDGQEESTIVPDAVGKKLQLAIDTMQLAGYNELDFEDETGRRQRPIRWSKWLVVGQSPAPGTDLAVDLRVTLQVKKIGE